MTEEFWRKANPAYGVRVNPQWESEAWSNGMELAAPSARKNGKSMRTTAEAAREKTELELAILRDKLAADMTARVETSLAKLQMNPNVLTNGGSKKVLMVGGPMDGKVVSVEASNNYIHCNAPMHYLEWDTNAYPVPSSNILTYRILQYAILGRLFWIGHLETDPTPTQDLMFNALLNDKAKEVAT